MKQLVNTIKPETQVDINGLLRAEIIALQIDENKKYVLTSIVNRTTNSNKVGFTNGEVVWISAPTVEEVLKTALTDTEYKYDVFVFNNIQELGEWLSE